MKWGILWLVIGYTQVAWSNALDEVVGYRQGDSSDYTWFRNYAERMKIPVLGEGAIRVFYMREGGPLRAIEVDLASGDATIWEGIDPSYPPIKGKIREKLRLQQALVEKDLEAIPFDDKRLVRGGFAYLLEYRHDDGYFYRLARAPESGYFRSLVYLVDAYARPIYMREWHRRQKEGGE